MYTIRQDVLLEALMCGERNMLDRIQRGTLPRWIPGSNPREFDLLEVMKFASADERTRIAKAVSVAVILQVGEVGPSVEREMATVDALMF